MARLLGGLQVLRAAISFLLCIPLSIVAHAEKRVALVVGIDRYDNLGAQQQLQRAVNDARSVGSTLRVLGFQVIAAENVRRAAFNEQWQKFLDSVQPGNTAVIYFSGHGVEIEGLNFLIPRDLPKINYGRQEQLKRESLSVSELLLDLRKRKPQVAVVILDACRDHPLIPPEYRSAGGASGLARMDAPAGTFIMYSAGAGETALDRLPGNDPDQTNSVYTRRLLPLLRKPGLALPELARQVRAEVSDLAANVPHTQRPAYYDGMVGKFCMSGCETMPAMAPLVSEAERAWNNIKDTTNTGILQAYARQFDGTVYGAMAQARLEELRKLRIAKVDSQFGAETAGEVELQLPPIKTSRNNPVPACTTPGRLMAYLKARNPEPDPRFDGLANEYMRIGDMLGVRWDYAFYQMIIETNSLSYRRGSRAGDVKPEQNNFASLGATGGGAAGESFKDISSGVRAHMEHLLLYAGDRINSPVADRTRKVQEWGVLTNWRASFDRPITFSDMASKWAPGTKGYALALLAIADRFEEYCRQPDPRPELLRAQP